MVLDTTNLTADKTALTKEGYIMLSIITHMDKTPFGRWFMKRGGLEILIGFVSGIVIAASLLP